MTHATPIQVTLIHDDDVTPPTWPTYESAEAAEAACLAHARSEYEREHGKTLPTDYNLERLEPDMVDGPQTIFQGEDGWFYSLSSAKEA